MLLKGTTIWLWNAHKNLICVHKLNCLIDKIMSFGTFGSKHQRCEQQYILKDVYIQEAGHIVAS